MNPSFAKHLAENVRQDQQHHQYSNALPDLDSHPVEWPCQNFRDQINQLEVQTTQLTIRNNQMEMQLTQSQEKSRTLREEKRNCLERQGRCSSQLDMLISNIETQSGQVRPTCPPTSFSACQPCAECPKLEIPTTAAIPYQRCPSTTPCPEKKCPVPPIPTPCPACRACPPTAPPCTTCPTKPPLSPCPTCQTCPPEAPPCPPCRTCPMPAPCPIKVCPKATICPACSTCPICPTAMPKLISTNLTTQTTRGNRAAPHQPTRTGTAGPVQTTQQPHFQIYNLLTGEWHQKVAPGSIHFSEEGKMALDLDYVHIINDFNLKEYMNQGKMFCGQTIDKELKRLNETSQRSVYGLLYRAYSHRCKRIVDQLHDTFDTFVSGSHSYMYHTFQKQSNPLHTNHHTAGYTSPVGTPEETEEERHKRQLLIIGALLLGLGVIAAGGAYLMSHSNIASLSMGSYTNPATIKILKKHEKRLNIDEKDIRILKESVKELIVAENKTQQDVKELQMLHKIEEMLSKLHWDFFTLSLGLEKLRLGKLSSFLVKPIHLQNILKNFRERLSTIGTHTVITDINEIFQCDTSFLVFQNLTIRSFTHIPIYKPEGLMTVYRYQSLPYLLKNHLLEFRPHQKFIAVNKAKQLYRPLANDALLHCIKFKHVRYCKDNNIAYKELHESCIHSLYSSSEQEIINNCPIKLTPIQDTMVRLNHEYVILFHKELNEAKMTCSMGLPQKDTITFKGFRKIRVFPGCRLETNQFIVDGANDYYTEPSELQMSLPSFDEVQQFKDMQQHLNNSIGTEHLDEIVSQKDLRVKDINGLFKKYAYTNTLTLSLIGGVVSMIGMFLFCCCFVKCCWPIIKRKFQKPTIQRSRRHDYEPPTEQYEMPRRRPTRPPPPEPSVSFTRQTTDRKSYRNPAGRMNVLYPQED